MPLAGAKRSSLNVILPLSSLSGRTNEFGATAAAEWHQQHQLHQEPVATAEAVVPHKPRRTPAEVHQEHRNRKNRQRHPYSKSRCQKDDDGET